MNCQSIILYVVLNYMVSCLKFLDYILHFAGFGCDTEAVIEILAHRDAMQRALIQQEYSTMYSTDLLKKLASELRGKLEVST